MSVENLTAPLPETDKPDLSVYCTLKRQKSKKSQQKSLIRRGSLSRRPNGDSADSYTGTRVSKVPDPTEYALKDLSKKPALPNEIHLDLEAAKLSVQQTTSEKPRLSEKAWNRLSRKHKRNIEKEGENDGSSGTNALATGGREDGQGGDDRKVEVPDGAVLRAKGGRHRLKSVSPPPDVPPGVVASSRDKGNSHQLHQRYLVPVITHDMAQGEARSNGGHRIHSIKSPTDSGISSPPDKGLLHSGLGNELSAPQTRHSIRSIDSGLGEDPTNADRELASEVSASYSPSSTVVHSSPSNRQPQALAGVARLILPKGGFSSLRGASSSARRHRKSMLLSDLYVMTVSLPADLASNQRGKGAILKFRFSPYTQIELLRVAILKQFHERFEIAVHQLSKFHLCRYLEEEEGWEWLEEDQALNEYQLPAECKLELKQLEPVYRDVRVVIPQLECSMSVEYDQFSTVGDVLHQVLSLSEPPLDPAEGYSLYHVRLRVHMDPSDSMVYYQILPSDVLECRLSVGRLHSVILTVKIPSIQSSRKVKVSLDETVGELISTLMRRVPDPESPRWNHMALYLYPRKPSTQGSWMEDYKFLAAYKLKPTDVLEFRPKYRAMIFELRVFPHDHYGESELPYASPELLVAQDTLVSEVIDLLCNSSSLEYDPRFYGLFLHDDSQLPTDVSMWEHLDETSPGGYQDTLIMHMIHKPIQVSLQGDEESFTTIMTDFSQPCRVVRDFLCRRYGIKHHRQYGLQYEGIALNLSLSLHNQGILETEHIMLIHIPIDDPTPRIKTSSPRSDSESDSRRSSLAPEDEVNVWDEGPDSEKNIRYDSRHPNFVIGASFNKLVERVTSEKDHDLEFVKTFLYTYQSFATPERLLHKLIERYNVVRQEGQSAKAFAVMKQTIQARVINALKLWVDLSVDFKDNASLQDELLHFVSSVLILDHPRLCKPLRTNIMVIKGVIHKKNLKMFRDPPPPVKFPSNSTGLLTIFDFDPEEVARQMTLIDFKLFAKIKPAELLNQAWQKAKYKHRAVNILRLVERMNNLTLWVATTILSQRDVHERAKRIGDFVQISTHLLDVHNLCTLMSVLNGLAHPAITRLKKSFSKMDKSANKKLESLQMLARPGDNFRLLREQLKRSSNPCIPYLGLYMSDLTFLDNGNPNFHSNGLINFSKCRLIYNQIRDLVLRQDKPYNFEEVPALHESLTKFHFLDTDILYDVSLQREPRDKGK